MQTVVEFSIKNFVFFEQATGNQLNFTSTLTGFNGYFCFRSIIQIFHSYSTQHVINLFSILNYQKHIYQPLSQPFLVELSKVQPSLILIKYQIEEKKSRFLQKYNGQVVKGFKIRDIIKIGRKDNKKKKIRKNKVSINKSCCSKNLISEKKNFLILSQLKQDKQENCKYDNHLNENVMTLQNFVTKSRKLKLENLVETQTKSGFKYPKTLQQSNYSLNKICENPQYTNLQRNEYILYDPLMLDYNENMQSFYNNISDPFLSFRSYDIQNN